MYIENLNLVNFSPGLSSFENLLSKPIQRITVWLVATFTCVANILVILGRFTARDENQALSFVVRNLAGIYLRYLFDWKCSCCNVFVQSMQFRFF